jgi:S-layer homology domain
MKVSAHRLLGVSFALAASSRLSAQVPPPSPPVPGAGVPVPVASGKRTMKPKFGVTGRTYKQFAAMAFTAMDSSEAYSLTGAYSGQVLRVASGDTDFFAVNLDLPDGAQVTYLELDGCDDTGEGGDVEGTLVQSDSLGNVGYSAPFVQSDGSGCNYYFEELSPSLVINNFTSHYWLLANIVGVVDHTTGLAGMVVGYSLQVPAFTGQDFTDVPKSSPQFAFIEALYHAGVTAGCGGGKYCPDNPVTRGQMAVFLAKALGLYN